MADEKLKDKKILMAVLKGFHSFKDKQSIEQRRKAQELMGKISISTVKDLKFESFEIGGLPVEWIINTKKRADNGVILYCHGGGYCIGDLNYARMISSKVALESGIDVLTFAYRLAPEYSYPAQLDDGIKAWNYICSLGYSGKDIVVMGESAGSHLTLSITEKLKMQGKDLPRALVLMSPWVDLLLSSNSFERCKDTDPVITYEFLDLCRVAFSRGLNLKEASMSPLYTTFTGYPDTYIQVGTNEILHDDAKSLYENMKKFGVNCKFDDFKGMWHVFQMFPIKDSQIAIEKVAEYLNDIFSST